MADTQEIEAEVPATEPEVTPGDTAVVFVATPDPVTPDDPDAVQLCSFCKCSGQSCGCGTFRNVQPSW